MSKSKKFDNVVETMMVESAMANTVKGKAKLEKMQRSGINTGMGQANFLAGLKNDEIDRQEERNVRTGGTAPSPFASRAHESTMELFEALGQQIIAIGPKVPPKSAPTTPAGP